MQLRSVCILLLSIFQRIFIIPKWEIQSLRKRMRITIFHSKEKYVCGLLPRSTKSQLHALHSGTVGAMLGCVGAASTHIINCNIFTFRQVFASMETDDTGLGC